MNAEQFMFRILAKIVRPVDLPQHFTVRGELYTIGPDGTIYHVRHDYDMPIFEVVMRL